MCQVAQAMGYQEGFAYSSPRDIFVEHAALSKFKNTGNRLFNIGALSALSETEYDQLEPIQWPVTPESPTGTKRLFIDGRFPTPSGKAQFISSTAELPRQSLSDKFPLALNSGRIRDQWHTMTRTGRAARLLDHIEQPFVAIHPDTALAYNLKEDDLARVTTAQGDLELCVVLEIGLKPNQIFIPIHWNNQFAKSARVDSLVAPIVDGISGQPEFKFTPAIIAKIDVPCWAVLVSRNKLNCEPFINWSLSPLDNNQGYLYQVAVSANFNWQDFIALKRLIDQGPAQAYEHYADGSASDERFICYSDQQIEMAIFTHADKSQLPGRAWLQRLFVEQVDGNYWPLIASSTKPDQGKQVCSCFKVSEKTITDAIERGACSAQELGRQLQCGTNCGSCIPELNNLITQTLSLA
jgi:assimilatory nitrate reductase catalytic subunit